MTLGIGHDGDDAFVVFVSFTGGSSSQRGHEFDRLTDVVNGDVEMDATLTHLRLSNRLEHESGLRITANAEVHPPFLGRARFATQRCTPEPCHSLRVKAVEGHPGPHRRHRTTLRRTFPTTGRGSSPARKR